MDVQLPSGVDAKPHPKDGWLCAIGATRLFVIHALVSWVLVFACDGQQKGTSVFDESPFFLCVEERSAFTSGQPPVRKMFYFDQSGYVQNCTISDKAVISYSEDRMNSVGSEALAAGITALGDGGEDPSYGVFRESLLGEWHPAVVTIVARRPDGTLVRWLGTTHAVPGTIAALCSGFKGKTNTEKGEATQHGCYFRAAVLLESAVQRFEKDGLFFNIGEGPAQKTKYLFRATAKPYRLFSVPDGINPFLPFHPSFKAGNMIEIKYGGMAFQVESYSDKTEIKQLNK